MVLEEERDPGLEGDLFSNQPLGDERRSDIMVGPRSMEEETICVTYQESTHRGFVGFKEEVHQSFEFGGYEKMRMSLRGDVGQKKIKDEKASISYMYNPGRPEPDNLLGIETEPPIQTQFHNSFMEEPANQGFTTNLDDYEDWEEDLDGAITSNQKVIIVKEVPKIVAKPKTFERVFTFSDQQSADNFVNRKTFKRRYKGNANNNHKPKEQKTQNSSRGGTQSQGNDEAGNGSPQVGKSHGEINGKNRERSRGNSDDLSHCTSFSGNKTERNGPNGEGSNHSKKYEEHSGQEGPRRKYSDSGRGSEWSKSKSYDRGGQKYTGSGQGRYYNGYSKYGSTGKKPVAAPSDSSKMNPRKSYGPADARCGWNLPFMNGGGQKPKAKPAAGESGNSQSTLNAFLKKNK